MDEHFGSKVKKTIRPGASVSPIISHLAVILHVLNPLWNTMEENLKLVILCDLRNLGLLDTLKVTPFAN